MISSDKTNSSENQANAAVSLREAFWTWCRVAMLSFGGPAGQIAVMHRILIDEKRWIDERRFLHALNYCMLLPGPEAQQLATYIGWLMHRTLGGIMAGTLFILPGFLSILGLSVIYTSYGDSLMVQGLFYGLKPAVIAIVFAAVVRIGRRILKNYFSWFLAGVAFVSIFLFNAPFPIVLLSAALLGYFFGGKYSVPIGHSSKANKGGDSAEQMAAPQIVFPQDSIKPTWQRSLRISVFCLTLWFAPLLIIRWLYGPGNIFSVLGWFFSKAAVVTFGGAYSVLAYIGQQAVENYHWLEPTEMLDGLGMAETTPGPLIMVVQFVGYMAGYRFPADMHPLTAAMFGSLITVWVTFVPCFFWIFLGAPYVERLRSNQTLNAVMSAITAAVVGVILNLAVWFTLHTLFRSHREYEMFYLRWTFPELGSFDIAAFAIACVAMVMTFYFKRGIAVMMTVCCVLGIACRYFGLA